MQIVQLNAAGKDIAPPITLDRVDRRLPQVLRKHVDQSRPYMVALRRASDTNTPLDELWVTRGWKRPPVRDEAGRLVKPGTVKPWPRRYLTRDVTVVVVYLPQGGGGAAGGGSRSKSPLAIVAGVAGLALAAFAGPLAGLVAPALAGALGVSVGVATFAVQAGLVIGGTALLALSSKSRASKQATDTREVYGVSGGGNLPKAGETVPRAYGRSWLKPDLSQPDFSKYEGDDQILFKRMTLTCGRGRAYQIRAGKQVVWTEAGGWIAPFDSGRNQVEFIYGTPSRLVPSNVISAAGVGGTLPRPQDNPQIAGPFLVNPRGALINKLEVSFQFPNGISRQTTLKSGTVQSNQPAAWAVYFEYAEINDGGAIVGPWRVLYNGNSGAEGARFGTKPMRYTKALDVPPGRYAVRGRNVQPDTSEATGTGNRIIDAAQWDSAVGYVADVAVRPGITECAMVLYAGKGNQAAAFGEIEIDFQAIIPAYVGNQWVEIETSKAVWAFCDVLRNQAYGAGMSDNATIGARDLAVYYANLLTEFDTFDAVIRGPVSVYEACASILLVMRAEPVYLGRYWSMVRDEPKAIRRHLLTPRQITSGSTRENFDLDTESGKNHVIGEFDQDGDYRNPNQCTAIYGEASRTPVRQRWTGVRTYAHAQHLTRWRASVGAYRNQSKEVGVELEGRIYKRGDSIGVVTWFLDTNKTAQVIFNDGYTLHLDTPIHVEPNDCIVLRDRTGREWGPVGIYSNGRSEREIIMDPAPTIAMEIQTGMSLAAVLSDDDTEMTSISVGQIEYLTENYLVQSVSMSGEDRATVTVINDEPEVFRQIGAPITQPPIGAAGLSDPAVPRIVAFTAARVQVAAGFICQYGITPGRGCVAFDVEISYDGGNHFDIVQDRAAATSGAFTLNPVSPMTVVLRCRPYGSTGLPGVYYYASLALDQSVLGVSLPPIDYDDLIADVQDRISKGVDALDKAIEATLQGKTNAAAIIDEATTRSTADTQTATRITGVVAQQGLDRAATATIETASVTRDTALGERIDLTVARLGTAEASVATEQTARATADSALSSQYTSVLAVSNAGTAAGQFSLSAVSAPGGVSARIQAFLATRAGGATRGAGYYLDLMPDGTSRFVIDASAFYITSNGQTAPTFSFDGYTLTIPSLRVTTQAILPNAGSDKYIYTVQNVDPGGPSPNYRELPGTSFVIDVDSSPGWGIILICQSNLTVRANGTANRFSSSELRVGFAFNGALLNSRPSNIVTVAAGGGLANNTSKSTGIITDNTAEILGPGQVRVSLVYAFLGDSAASATIELATIKAIVFKR